MSQPESKPVTVEAPLVPHRYAAWAIRVIDGDTAILDIDHGNHIHRPTRVRLQGIDAPEMRGETLAAGRAARAQLVGYLVSVDGPRPLVVDTELDASDKYGRLIGKLMAHVDGVGWVDVNMSMVATGHARVWPLVSRLEPGGTP